MTFETLRRVATPLLSNVLSHPFNTMLFEGTLPRTNFEYFLSQDAYYLNVYGQHMRTLSARAVKPEHKLAFQKFSDETIAAELHLHQTYAPEKLTVPCQSISAYLAHLDKHVTNAEFCVAVSSVLPCFWLYCELGIYSAIVQTEQAHPYRAWVETYAHPDFYQATELAISILNETSSDVSKHTKVEMTKVFLESTEHEIAFWEEAHCFTPPLSTIRLK